MASVKSHEECVVYGRTDAAYVVKLTFVSTNATWLTNSTPKFARDKTAKLPKKGYSRL